MLLIFYLKTSSRFIQLRGNQLELNSVRYPVLFLLFSQPVLPLPSLPSFVLEINHICKPVQLITGVSCWIVIDDLHWSMFFSLISRVYLKIAVRTASGPMDKSLLLPPGLVFSQLETTHILTRTPLTAIWPKPLHPVVTPWPARGSLLLLVWYRARLYAL